MLDIPIAVALGIVAVVAMVVTQGLSALPNVPITVFTGAANFPLIAIPLFILAGAIMNASGISTRLIAFASILGFISMIVLGAIFGGVVSATEGAALAVVAALFIGLVIYRELDMKKLRTANGNHRRRRANSRRG